jgi:hypothetical protein
MLTNRFQRFYLNAVVAAAVSASCVGTVDDGPDENEDTAPLAQLEQSVEDGGTGEQPIEDVSALAYRRHRWRRPRPSAPADASVPTPPAQDAAVTPPKTDASTPPQPPQASFWPSGTDGLNRDFANAFGAWRGRPTTSAWININWVQWDWLTAPGLNSTLDGVNPTPVWDLYKDWSGVMVLSAAMAGSTNSPDYDSNMRACATGAYDGYWRTFAQNAAAHGRNGDNTVISLAHEFNGTWFKWNPSKVGLDVWLSCWRHVYTAIHERSSLRVVWVFSAAVNTTAGGDYSVASAWDAYPGDAYVDVIGVNRYDFKALGSATSNDWRATCGNPQDICAAAKFAREHGKLLGIPEWSMDRGIYGNPDRVGFVQMMHQFFVDNRDVLMFENHFDNGAHGDWYYYPVISGNMISGQEYQRLWKQ